MKYCVKCGNQLNDADCFCSKCGTPSASVQNVTGMPPVPTASSIQEKLVEQHEEEKKAEQAKRIGTERKCPYCGYNKVPLFAISCPECKREFNSTKVDPSINKFFEEINNYSIEYRTDEDKTKLGLFCCLKVILICFGALILMGGNTPSEFNLDSGLPLYIVGGLLVLTGILVRIPLPSSIIKKRNYIETFIVPNNKESVIEFLLLSSSKIQTGGNPFTKEGRSTLFWNKVWKTKIKQSVAKANILFVDDEDAQKKVAAIKKQFKIN